MMRIIFQRKLIRVLLLDGVRDHCKQTENPQDTKPKAFKDINTRKQLKHSATSRSVIDELG